MSATLVRTLSIAVVLACVLLSQQPSGVLSKEVEVTKEWTLLGENDTIPAGAHVRMDMTTGEKWVKEMDDDDGDEDKIIDKDKASSNQGGTAVVVGEDGTISSGVAAGSDGSNKPSEEPQYDFDMMHRTLSKLPAEEQERYGGLPELPTGSSSTNTKSEERKQFEVKMKRIWEERQRYLKEIEYELMDVPELLKQRVRSMKEYLSDPTTHLKENDLDEESEDGLVTHIVSVLQDLEYQLSDIDMARDFHTLGGWPLLVSLLSPEVHVSQNFTLTVDPTSPPKAYALAKKLSSKIKVVQAHAAHAVGTAVKNTAEFFPFAVEEVEIQKDVKTTAIDSAIQIFAHDHDDLNAWETRKLLERSLYAIGALLRGNRSAQVHTCASSGPLALGKVLQRSATMKMTSTNLKLTQRLLALASDIVSDVSLHGELEMEQLNTVIVKSFTTREWCDTTIGLVTSDKNLPVQLQEQLLQTAHVLAPYCDWVDHVDVARKAVAQMQDEWNGNNEDELDPHHHEEMVGFAKAFTDTLENTGERR